MDGLTAEELRLADHLTTDTEWRDIYQPQGVGFRNYPLPDKSRAAGNAGQGADVLAGTGEAACDKPVREAAEWRRIGEWIVCG